MSPSATVNVLLDYYFLFLPLPLPLRNLLFKYFLSVRPWATKGGYPEFKNLIRILIPIIKCSATIKTNRN
jgi:hypothetical protein